MTTDLSSLSSHKHLWADRDLLQLCLHWWEELKISLWESARSATYINICSLNHHKCSFKGSIIIWKPSSSSKNRNTFTRHKIAHQLKIELLHLHSERLVVGVNGSFHIFKIDENNHLKLILFIPTHWYLKTNNRTNLHHRRTIVQRLMIDPLTIISFIWDSHAQ